MQAVGNFHTQRESDLSPQRSYLTAVALNHVTSPNTTERVITASTIYRPGGSASSTSMFGVVVVVSAAEGRDARPDGASISSGDFEPLILPSASMTSVV